MDAITPSGKEDNEKSSIIGHKHRGGKASPGSDVIVLQPDGGWGWVVCFTAFICNGTIFGILVCSGIIFVAIVDEFGKNDRDVATKTAFVGSLCIGLTLCLCSVAGVVSDKVGIRTTGLFGGVMASIGMLTSAFVADIRWLWLTYGVLLGSGLAFVYNPSLVILGHYFKRHHGLVNGIYTTGGNVFAIALSLGFPRLLDAVGFKYGMLALTTLTAITIPCALTWRPVLPRRRQVVPLTDVSTDESGRSIPSSSCCGTCLNVTIWRNKHYLILIVAEALNYFAYSILLVHLVNHVKGAFPDHDANLVVLFITVAGSFSQLTVGRLADFPWAHRVRILQASFGCFGLCFACVPWVGGYGGLVVLALLIGVCQGGFITLLAPITVDLVGYQDSSQALGFVLGIMCLPSTVSPPLAGYLFDKYGTYSSAFCIAGGLSILAAILLFCIPRSRSRSHLLNPTESIRRDFPDSAYMEATASTSDS